MTDPKPFDCFKFTGFCPVNSLKACIDVCEDSEQPPVLDCDGYTQCIFAGDDLSYSVSVKASEIAPSNITYSATFTLKNDTAANVILPQVLELNFLGNSTNIDDSALVSPSNDLTIPPNESKTFTLTGIVPGGLNSCDVNKIKLTLPIGQSGVNGSPLTYSNDFGNSICPLINCFCKDNVLFIKEATQPDEDGIEVLPFNNPTIAFDYGPIAVGVVTDGVPSCSSNLTLGKTYQLYSNSDDTACGNTVCENESTIVLNVQCVLPEVTVKFDNKTYITDNWCACKTGTIVPSCTQIGVQPPNSTDCVPEAPGPIIKYKVNLDNVQDIVECRKVIVTVTIPQCDTLYPKQFYLQLLKKTGVNGTPMQVGDLQDFVTATTLPPFVFDGSSIATGDLVYAQLLWFKSSYNLSTCSNDGVNTEYTIKTPEIPNPVSTPILRTNTTIKDELGPCGELIKPNCPPINPTSLENYVIVNSTITFSNSDTLDSIIYGLCDAIPIVGNLNNLLSALIGSGYSNLNDLIPKNGPVYLYDTVDIVYFVDPTGCNEVCNDFSVSNVSDASLFCESQLVSQDTNGTSKVCITLQEVVPEMVAIKAKERSYNGTKESTNVTRDSNNTIKTPNNAIKAPTNTIKTPTNTIKAPTNTIKTPTNTIKTPTNAIKAPTNAIKPSNNVIKPSSNAIKPSSNAIKAPISSIKAPTNAINPSNNAIKIPISSIKTPTNAIKTPIEIKSLVSTIKSSNTNDASKLTTTTSNIKITPLNGIVPSETLKSTPGSGCATCDKKAALLAANKK